jgi:hypothetical protein
MNEINAPVLIVAGIVALIALVLAVMADRGAERRREALIREPERPLPGIDAGEAPEYVVSEDVHGETEATPLSDDDRERIRDHIADQPRFEAGLASDRFVTDPDSGWGVFDHPLVVVTPRVSAFRELFPVIAAAKKEDAPLVVVTASLDEEPRETFAINVAAGKIRGAVAVAASEAELERLATDLGIAVIDEITLKSGFLSPAAIARPARWVADEHESWVDVDALPPTEGDD